MGRPADHTERMNRVALALDGLSVGDAFGERFFLRPEVAVGMVEARAEPRAPWRWTDDTMMAASVAGSLLRHGGIDQDWLAAAFAARYREDPWRGYGGTAHGILQNIGEGSSWRVAAREVFQAQGSMGNGAAMRVAPVGAYFADDLDAVVTHATRSAEVTHAHRDGQAGAVAVAVAAAWAWRYAQGERGPGLLETARALTPPGDTREGLRRALALPPESSVGFVASVLGSGLRVISSDTVPFSLWCAARWCEDYEEALWQTVSGLGDRDTTCAIVGGVVALCAGRGAIPPAWLAAREALPG
jgi:ADP-ribosylglycohydrolase